MSRICHYYNLRVLVKNVGPKNSGRVKVLTNIMSDFHKYFPKIFLTKVYYCTYLKSWQEHGTYNTKRKLIPKKIFKKYFKIFPIFPNIFQKYFPAIIFDRSLLLYLKSGQEHGAYNTQRTIFPHKKIERSF